MSRYTGLLEKHRLQAFPLGQDKWTHILTAEQGVDPPTQVLYKRRGYLGGGSFGAVHLEILASDCENAPDLRAVKSIDKAAAQASRVNWQHEVENLLVLSQFPDLFVHTYGWWEDQKFIYLPMEYFEASDLSRNRDFIENEDDIRSIARQIALGLDKLHSLDIMHRDIKPQNIFVVRREPQWHVKVGDFGFSKRISDSVTAPFSARGTMRYMAPEYRDLTNSSESSDFTPAVDMWSFGCLVYELFAKKGPFDDPSNNALMKYMRDGIFPRKALDDCGATNESITVVKKLLEREPHNRLAAHDALHSQWLSTNRPSSVHNNQVQDAQDRNSQYGARANKPLMLENQHLGGRLWQPNARPAAAVLGNKVPSTMTNGLALKNEKSSDEKKDLEKKDDPSKQFRPLSETRYRSLSETRRSEGLGVARLGVVANAPPEKKPHLEVQSNSQRNKEIESLISSAEQQYHGFMHSIQETPKKDPYEVANNLKELRKLGKRCEQVLISSPHELGPSTKHRIQTLVNSIGSYDHWSDSNTSNANLKHKQARALYDFDAPVTGDLGFRKGDIITITHRTDNNTGWWTGTIGNHTGIFPSNYVEMIDPISVPLQSKPSTATRLGHRFGTAVAKGLFHVLDGSTSDKKET